MIYWILDLCSGLGGASEAFTRDPNCVIVRVELNPDNFPELEAVPFTRILDVKNWMDWLPDLIDEMGGPPLFIWASPPCLEFSTGFHAPAMKAKRAGEDFNPDMSIVEACYDIIQYAEPSFWALENVVGALSHFKPLLGRHSHKIGPFYLWGNFPTLGLVKIDHKKDSIAGNSYMGANRRAVVPFALSEAMMMAILRQSTLWDWV